MRIAFFTDTYLPNRDGVVTSIINFREELEKLGHEVFIFTPGMKKQKEENKDPKVHYFTSASFKPYPDYRIALFPFLSAVKAVKELNVDIIHSHGIATTGLAAIRCSEKLKIPAVATFHTMVPEATHYISKGEKVQRILTKIAWKYLRWYYSHFRKVITQSEHTAKVLREHGIENIVMLPLGIDYRFYSSGEGEGMRKRHSLGRKKVVLSVGRMVREKNLELLIEEAPSIVNKLENVRFVLVGAGPEEESFKNAVKLKGVEEYFIFTGFVPKKELPDYYAAADVFAFPSTFDTQGLVAIEAMAAGTPVVVSAQSAAAELVDEGKDGYIFKDPMDFREKILLAMERKKEMGGNARKKASTFARKGRFARMLELYNSILSSP